MTKPPKTRRSAIDLELVVIPAVSPVGCLGGRPPGEGDFSVAGDRVKLRPLLVEALKRKLLLLLEAQDSTGLDLLVSCQFRLKDTRSGGPTSDRESAQDLVNYRLLLNLQSVHFRGFPEARPFEPIPGFQAQPLPRSDRFHSFLDSSEGLQSGGAGGARPLLVARHGGWSWKSTYRIAFLLLVTRPGAPTSILAPSSDALYTSVLAPRSEVFLAFLFIISGSHWSPSLRVWIND